MGFGDVKLVGCIGAFCGWQGCLFSILAGAVMGTIVVLACGIWQWIVNKHPLTIRNKCVPFGPFISIAVVFYIFIEKAF